MVDYEKVDKAVEELMKLHPDIPHYILWVMATDYYINEEKSEEKKSRYEDENFMEIKHKKSHRKGKKTHRKGF